MISGVVSGMLMFMFGRFPPLPNVSVLYLFLVLCISHFTTSFFFFVAATSMFCFGATPGSTFAYAIFNNAKVYIANSSNYLQKNGKQSLDIVALECDFPIFKISSILLTMELKGIVRPLPGKLFEAV